MSPSAIGIIGLLVFLVLLVLRIPISYTMLIVCYKTQKPVSRLPFEMANWAANLNLPSFVVMGIILIIYGILGCFIDALALILLTVHLQH